MIQKKPQNRLISGIRKSITTVLILEVLAFAGTYCVWRRLNRDQGNSNISKRYWCDWPCGNKIEQYYQLFQHEVDLIFKKSINPCENDQNSFKQSIFIEKISQNKIDFSTIFFSDFRFYMHENFPYILNGYYYSTQYFNEDLVRRIRESDKIGFEQKRKVQQQKQQ